MGSAAAKGRTRNTGSYGTAWRRGAGVPAPFLTRMTMFLPNPQGQLISITGSGLNQATLREVAPSPAVFNLVKRSEDFKGLLLQAQHKDGVLIRAGPTHDKGSVKGRTFTVWGPREKAETYKQKVNSLVSRRKQSISRVAVEVRTSSDRGACSGVPVQ